MMIISKWILYDTRLYGVDWRSGSNKEMCWAVVDWTDLVQHGNMCWAVVD